MSALFTHFFAWFSILNPFSVFIQCDFSPQADNVIDI